MNTPHITARAGRTGAAAGILALLFAQSALAHSPYLLPNSFSDEKRDHVTLQASASEDLFVPDFALKSDQYHALLPSGESRKGENLTVLKDVVIFEAPLAEPGTYRFSTGERSGQPFRMAKVKGEWAPLRGRDAAPPAEAEELAESRSVMRAETYVTRGMPSDAAVRPLGRGLEIHAITHPTTVSMAGGFALELLLDGKPVPGVALSVQREGEEHGGEEEPSSAGVRTDGAGKAVLRFEEPGVHLISARHMAEAPAGSDTRFRSYAYSVTIRVAR